jgi:hypothetical protein
VAKPNLRKEHSYDKYNANRCANHHLCPGGRLASNRREETAEKQGGQQTHRLNGGVKKKGLAAARAAQL